MCPIRGPDLRYGIWAQIWAQMTINLMIINVL